LDYLLEIFKQLPLAVLLLLAFYMLIKKQIDKEHDQMIEQAKDIIYLKEKLGEFKEDVHRAIEFVKDLNVWHERVRNQSQAIAEIKEKLGGE
jgi:hypothetical protein